LHDAFAADVKSVANQRFLGEIFTASCKYLARLKTTELRSLISNKEYFSFTDGKKVSRAVNKRLFLNEPSEWDR
jgi:hypothetical protein